MGFGSLIDSGAQNNLTSLQQGVNTIGANMENQAAQAQAGALQAEAGNVFEQSQVQAEQALIQGKQAYGQQAEQFSENGVELTGTPADTLHQTVELTQQNVSMIQQAGQLQQQLLLTQANQAQMTGLSDLLGAQGENQITEQQNQITQAAQKQQILDSIFSGALGFGGGLLDSILPTVLKGL